jgi:hypothetical protein
MQMTRDGVHMVTCDYKLSDNCDSSTNLNSYQTGQSLTLFRAGC